MLLFVLGVGDGGPPEPSTLDWAYGMSFGFCVSGSRAEGFGVGGSVFRVSGQSGER